MILFILEKFPSKSEHFISNEILGLHEAGVNFQIIALKKETSDSLLEQLPVTYISSASLLFTAVKYFQTQDIYKLWKTYQSVNQFLRQLKIVVIGYLIQSKFPIKTIAHIHSHFAFLPTEIALHLANVTGIPFSFTAHAQDLYANDSRKLQTFIKQAKFVFTCTQFGKKYLQKVSSGSENIHCIYHGISLEKWIFQQVKEVNYPVIKILFVGRMVEKKGARLLLKALERLIHSNKSIQCTFVGYGPLIKGLMAYSDELGVSKHVCFVGYEPHDQLIEYYRDHDLLICPSIQAENFDMDGLPNVILEAMAVGLPVIASNLSGIPEIISHRETGMLFNAGDTEGIVQHIKTLSSNKALYTKIRNAARKQLENKFDLKRSNLQIEALLKFAMPS